jgi:hypothetical protein
MTADQFLATLGHPGETGWALVPAVEALLSSTIPARTVGVYLLCANRQLIYAGRSDHCLRRRLVWHEHLPHARVIRWRACRGPQGAYVLEKQWYHRLLGRPGVLNRIEPALPGPARDDAAVEHVPGPVAADY